MHIDCFSDDSAFYFQGVSNYRATYSIGSYVISSMALASFTCS